MAENFFLNVKISDIDKDSHRVKGYATTEALDCYVEKVKRDAVDEALPDYAEYGTLREQHTPSLGGAGVVDVMLMDEKGLWIEAEVVNDKVWKNVIKGVYKSFSIGFQTLKKVKVGAVTWITKLKLFEISIVDRGANPETDLTGASYKSASCKAVFFSRARYKYEDFHYDPVIEEGEPNANDN